MIIKTIGNRRSVVMCLNGHIDPVHVKMYCSFNILNCKIGITFRLKSVRSEMLIYQHTIVFTLKKGIGYVPAEYKGIFQSIKEFVYLCCICGGDRRRIVVYMHSRHSIHIVNLDNFLYIMRYYNIRTDETFVKTINIPYLMFYT